MSRHLHLGLNLKVFIIAGAAPVWRRGEYPDRAPCPWSHASQAGLVGQL